MTTSPATAALGTQEGKAPKDGTWFLGTFTDGETRRVSWGINRHDQKCWCTPTWYYFERELKSWQPLPASHARTIGGAEGGERKSEGDNSSQGSRYRIVHSSSK